MKKTYYYSKQQVTDFVTQCTDYAMACEPNERDTYMAELYDIINEDVDVWFNLCTSGIFHDAVGKVLEMNDNEIVVTTDY